MITFSREYKITNKDAYTLIYIKMLLYNYFWLRIYSARIIMLIRFYNSSVLISCNHRLQYISLYFLIWFMKINNVIIIIHKILYWTLHRNLWSLLSTYNLKRLFLYFRRSKSPSTSPSRGEETKYSSKRKRHSRSRSRSHSHSRSNKPKKTQRRRSGSHKSSRRSRSYRSRSRSRDRDLEKSSKHRSKRRRLH